MNTNIVVAVFPSRAVMLRALNHLTDTESILIKRAAVVAKAATGEFVVLDDDMSPNEGTLAGLVLGAAVAALGMIQLGAFTLPLFGAIFALIAAALVGALVGSLIGRFVAHLVDSGFPGEVFQALSQRLEEGHPALVIELAQPEVALAKLRQALKAYNAELVEPLHRALTANNSDESE